MGWCCHADEGACSASRYCLHVDVGRDHRHAQRSVEGYGLIEQCQPVHARHVDVGQDEGDLGMLDIATRIAVDLSGIDGDTGRRR